MYVILVYDMGVDRVAKMLKLCRRYLQWVQNSVFEGEISEVLLKELLDKAEKIMKKEEDSLIVYVNQRQLYMKRMIVGREKNSLDNIL